MQCNAAAAQTKKPMTKDGSSYTIKIKEPAGNTSSVITASDSLANKPKKPFIPPLIAKNGSTASIFKIEKEEARKTMLASIFPKDLQSLGEYKQHEDKRAKAMGTAQLPYWFIECERRAGAAANQISNKKVLFGVS